LKSVVVYFSTATNRRSRGALWSIIAPPFIAIERGAVFALDQHKIAHRCFESKNETWAVSIESTQIGSDYIF
jgi:hypothetical protein